jgi:hypothetical protein
VAEDRQRHEGTDSAWRRAAARLRNDIHSLDPAKLMIAPILFVALLALADRALYEFQRVALPGTPERVTRL